jgi:hypothetical protein
MLRDTRTVISKLQAMREAQIWPNGLRYLWTDAFGVVLLVSLYDELRDKRYLREAEAVVAEVDRVLGRKAGYRIGEEPSRDGQYYHYLAMWIFALTRLGSVDPEYRRRAIEIVREIHPHFVRADVGVLWKMKEDLSGPYPGFGLGALDPFHGYVVYRLLDPRALSAEIDEMERLVSKSYRSLSITQDLGLGVMLWITHFFPTEDWAVCQRRRSLATLDRLWTFPPGYFCREPRARGVKFAFTNYGVSLGLQSVGAHPDRVARVNHFFGKYRSGDDYDTSAITHVMACVSHFPGEMIQRPAARRMAEGAW